MTKITAIIVICILAIITLMSSCNGITDEKLYGEWQYTKLENPDANPPSAEPDWKLKLEHPSIVFTKNHELTIWWDGKVLSHGTFKVDGKNIQYKEVLADGKTREFPFLVSKLTDSEIVFETMGNEGSRVTAVKK